MRSLKYSKIHNNNTMEEIITHACGLDVHKKTVVATIICPKIKKTRSFGTTTKELLNLSEWLKQHEISHVAMESTGPYWQPVYNILEDKFNIILANARYIKNVPGRKTDVKDSEWICKLLRCGLVARSLVLSKDFRHFRELSRYRRKLVEMKTSEKNRILKTLEYCNIKLSNVISDVFGKTGRSLLSYIFSEKEIEFPKLHPKVKSTKSQIVDSLEGNVSETHKSLIQKSLNHIEYLEDEISKIELKMSIDMSIYNKDLELLITVCGVSDIAARDILAFIGNDMNVFHSKRHIASWAGICPGNNESAGKKYSGRITHGNKNLKAILVECAWAASRTKDTYFAAKYEQLARKKGGKKALIAIAHKILISCYKVLKEKEEFRELGKNFVMNKKKENLKSSYVEKLTNLGFSVQVS